MDGIKGVFGDVDYVVNNRHVFGGIPLTVFELLHGLDNL